MQRSGIGLVRPPGRRRASVAAAVLTAACWAAPTRAAPASAPQADAAAAPLPAPRGQVEIRFEQDAAHRLLVRYRAPAGVSHLDFMLHDPRIDTVFRTPMLEPLDGCAVLVPGGIDLRHDTACEDGATFAVRPRALALNAFSEPAQPSSDGGVLFYTGYYAAAARDLDLRWTFVPERGGYVVDDGALRATTVSLALRTPVEGQPPAGLLRDSEAWLRQLHALNYVYLGRTPTESAEGLLWVRDPALPRAVVDVVGSAARVAWQGYAEGARAVPAGRAAIVVLRAPAGSEITEFHGDRSEGRMLRLSFIDPVEAPSGAQVERWGGFVAHEIAHLWNSGVFESDHAEPWLHEGDADWASLNVLHRAGMVSDASMARRLELAVNTCLVVRGDDPAWSFPKGWREQRDDPYACGLALQFLGWAEWHRRDPASIESPLARWGELHRRFPELGPVGFSAFSDEAGKPLMHELLLDDQTPFASTYRRDLSGLLPVQTITGEFPDAALRERIARRLFGLLGRGDCDDLSFSTWIGSGEIEIDKSSRCRALPAGAHVTTIAGERVMGKPSATWLAMQRQCADAARVRIGFADHDPVLVRCPADPAGAPVGLRLPVDVLRRLQLMPPPRYASTAAAAILPVERMPSSAAASR